MGLQETLERFKTADELGEFLKSTPEAVNASANYRPLLHYCQKGDGAEEFIRKLLEFGADPNLPNTKGATPLQTASVFGHDSLCEILLEAGANIDIISAAALGKIDVLKKTVLESPASLIELNPATGCTPLQAAVFRNQGNAIDFLLQNGADSSVQDDEGHDSIWLAEQIGNTKILDQLKSTSLANMSTTVESSLNADVLNSIEPKTATGSGYKPF